MSHCCGGCGGEDPLKKNEQAEEKDAKNSVAKESAKETSAPLETGTWQPAKK